jgi:ubiquinone/menaquinone biosynthesis C-methylase UbiE
MAVFMAKDWPEAQQKEQEFWTRWAANVVGETPGKTEKAPPIATDRAVDFARTTLARHHLTFKALDGKTVADIGCGPYGIIHGILNSGEAFAKRPILIGVDPLMDMYESKIGILRRQENVQLHAAKGESLPLADASADYVFCVNALDHVEAPESVVKELHRIVKPGGLCGVSLHTVTTPFSPVRRFLRYVDTNHPHHLTVEFVRRLLAKYFDRVEITHIANLTEDAPSFAFKYLFSAPNKPLALMRWMSTFILQSACFNCWKN